MHASALRCQPWEAVVGFWLLVVGSESGPRHLIGLPTTNNQQPATSNQIHQPSGMGLRSPHPAKIARPRALLNSVPMSPIAKLCGVASLCASMALPAAEPALVIDGRPDEAAWAKAQIFTDFVVVEPFTLGSPSHPTEARLLSTPQGIAISFRCTQPPGVPRLNERTPRDADIPGDRVNVFIDFNGDGETAFNFTIGMSGAIQDATVTNENNYSPDWDGDWQHARWRPRTAGAPSSCCRGRWRR